MEEKKNEETGSCEIRILLILIPRYLFFKDYIAAFSSSFFFVWLVQSYKNHFYLFNYMFFNSFFLKRTGLLIHVIKCQKKNQTVFNSRILK